MNKELINTIKQLKDISPSQEWRDDLGSRLESMARATFPAPEKVGLPAQAGFFVPIKTYFRFHHLVRATVIASLVLAVALGGSIFTVSAAKDSLPGNLLYNVKIAKEKVHMAITSQPEAKVKLKLSFAENRLKEANQLVNKVEGKDGRAIAKVMDDFQREIEEAEKHLAELKQVSAENPGIKEKIDETTEEINSQTEKYEIVLSQIKEKPFLEEEVIGKVDTALISSKKLAEAVKVAEDDEKPVEPTESVEVSGETDEGMPIESVETEPAQTASQIEAGREIIVVGPESVENEPIVVVEPAQNPSDIEAGREEPTDVATEPAQNPAGPEKPSADGASIEAGRPAQPAQDVEASEEVEPDFQGGIKKETIEFEGLMMKE